MLPVELFGDACVNQLSKPPILPPNVPKAPFFHPGIASIFA